MNRAGHLQVVRSPARPGPGQVPDQVLRALDITIGKRVSGLLNGDYRSGQTGQGTELALIRAYETGDDIRRIDWNVTARTGEPHVRAMVAERMLTTWLVLDTSASMHFGTAERRKADVAEGVAIAVGSIATRRGNRLGIMAYGSGDPRVIPPAQGRSGMLGVLETLRREHEAGDPAGKKGSLGDALGRIGTFAKMSRVVAIVSDFRGERDWPNQLLELAGRHTVLAIEIQDQRELELPDVGELWLIDPETGRQLRANTSSKDLRERFATAAKAERAEVAGILQKAGAHHIVLSTSGDWLRTFATSLSRKGARS